MYLIKLNHLPIEYITFDSTAPLLIVLLGLIQVFFSTILGWDHMIYSYFLGPNSESKKSCIINDEKKKNKSNQQLGLKKKSEDNERVCLNRGDMEIVFKSLGLFSSSKILDLDLDLDLVSKLFDEEVDFKEEEMKAAFDLFDENKDGFIDEFELQRVLCDLGFKEGLEIDNCKKMIMFADKNGDERLDFNGFVNLLG